MKIAVFIMVDWKVTVALGEVNGEITWMVCVSALCVFCETYLLVY